MGNPVGTPTSLSVELVLRADAFVKRGGDTLQAEHYRDELQMIGVDARIILLDSAAPRPRQGAVVHLFNVGQPFEFLEALRWAEDRPVVASTIYRSASSVAAMRSSDPIGPRRLASLLPESVRSLAVYTLGVFRRRPVRMSRIPILLARAFVQTFGLWKRLGRHLDELDAVLVLGSQEALALRNDLGWGGRNMFVTPNGVPLRRPGGSRERRTLVVGRIESGKRQLETLRVADEAGVPITFIGAPNLNQSSYVAEFTAAVATSRHSQWLGAVPHDEVTRLMAQSAVLLNCSWAEVQSLVDLEAASAGCWVVNTFDGGNSKEWLGEAVVEFAASDLRNALATAESLRVNGGDPPAFHYPHSWTSTAALLANCYREIRRYTNQAAPA